MSKKKDGAYWQDNLRILRIMLSIWLLVSFPLAIIFVDELDNIRIGGFGLGFWMAQQGAIFIYVVLIFVYIWLMDRLDLKHGVDEASLSRKHREN
jgi:putative solute:sodium symporter small subunit